MRPGEVALAAGYFAYFAAVGIFQPYWPVRQHIGQILDRPGADQSLPVRAPGGFGEGGRRHDDVDLLHRPVQLWKSQVVTHRKPKAPEGRIDHLHLPAGMDRALFGIFLMPQIQAEQVDLVIACNLRARVVVHQHAVVHAV